MCIAFNVSQKEKKRYVLVLLVYTCHKGCDSALPCNLVQYYITVLLVPTTDTDAVSSSTYLNKSAR